MSDPIDTSKHEPDKLVSKSFTDDEWLDIRVSLITASCAADAAMMHEHRPKERQMLDRARRSYLSLAERIAEA